MDKDFKCEDISKKIEEIIERNNKLPRKQIVVSDPKDCIFVSRNQMKCCEECIDRKFVIVEKKEKIISEYDTTTCRKKSLKEILLNKSGMRGEEIEQTFENAIRDDENEKFFTFLEEKWNKKDWLYIYSEINGNGKSYAANAIAHNFMDNGVSVLIKKEIEMNSELKALFNYKDTETMAMIMARWENVPLLVIQDFGKLSFKSEWWAGVMFAVIDNRYLNDKITLFTSNFDLKDLTAMKELFGEDKGMAIQSRIAGRANGKVIHITGRDRRKN